MTLSLGCMRCTLYKASAILNKKIEKCSNRSQDLNLPHVIPFSLGHYMFPRLRANREREDTMIGILVSPTLTPGGGKQCLTFWYNIEGNAISRFLALFN